MCAVNECVNQLHTRWLEMFEPRRAIYRKRMPKKPGEVVAPMDIGPFFYRMVGVPKQGDGAGRFLGTAFPITPDGGLITCRHVVEACTADESLATYDNEKHKLVPINTEAIIVPDSPDYLDLAFVPNALKRDKAEFFPLLEPAIITIGEDVYSFGYFRSQGGAALFRRPSREGMGLPRAAWQELLDPSEAG